MNKFMESYVNTYRRGLSVMDKVSVIYVIIAGLYTKGLLDFIDLANAGQLQIFDYIVMAIFSFFILSIFFIRLFMPCGHEEKVFLRNIHGDQINHYDGARSVWVCKKCTKCLYSQKLNEYQKR